MVRSILRCAFFALISALLPLSAAVTITISPTAATVNQKATKSFVATVSGSTLKTVTWSVIGTGNGTITTAGVYTAPAKAGTFKVRATSKANTSKYVEATVTVPDVAVSVTPSTAALGSGGTQQFSATVTGTTNTTVTWSASGGTITTSGKFTAPSTAGTYTITAKSSANTAKTATATVTVQVPATITAVSVSPAAATMNVGLTQAFSATVTGTGSFNNAVTWTTTGGTISGGTYTAPSAPGTYTVSATSVQDTSKKANATVTVVAPISVSINPMAVTLTVGRGIKFGYGISGASNTNVTWSVVESGGGTVDASGNYLAPAAPGIFTVQVASVADATKTAQAKVTVVAAPDGAITASPSVSMGATDVQASVSLQPGSTYAWSLAGGTLTAGQGTNAITFTAGTGTSLTLTCKVTNGAGDSITSTKTLPVHAVESVMVTVSPSSVTLPPGGTQLFTAVVTGTSNLNTSWGYSEGDLVQSGDGMLYTAPLAPGTYSVIVASDADDTKTATATITVQASGINVSISPSTVNLVPGASQNFAATVTGSTNTQVTWSVLESGGGTIGTSGAYTAPTAPGTYTVQASSKADPTQKATAKVTVSSSTVAITIDPASITLAPGGTQLFKATVTGTTNLSTQWSYNGGTLAQSGGGMLFTAPSTVGTYTITVASAADPTRKATATITVSNTVPIGVTISPAMASLAMGSTQAFTATVTGTTTDRTVTWTASEGSVSGSGIFTAPDQETTCTVTATSVADPSKSATSLINVYDPANIGKVILSPDTITVDPGGSATISATVVGSTQGVDWSPEAGSISYSPTKVTFRALYQGQPLDCGMYSLIATSKEYPEQSATASILVTQAVFIDPVEVRLWPGGTRRFSAQVEDINPASVTWSATGGSITADGTYTAPSEPGTYTVKATSTVRSTAWASATVTVTTDPMIQAFTVTPSVVAISETAQLAATYTNGIGQVDPGSLSVQSGTQVLVQPEGTTVYTLSVSNASGTTSTQDARVDVTGPGAFRLSTIALGVPQPDAMSTLLCDGRAFLAGGSPSYGSLVQIFDPETGALQPGPSLKNPRNRGTATLLADGRVLLWGGAEPGTNIRFQTDYEIVDPNRGTSTSFPIGSSGMGGVVYPNSIAIRCDHTGTRLADGRVLIAGGRSIRDGVGWSQWMGDRVTLDAALLFDPNATTSFYSTGAMTTSRARHVAIRLLDGRVLAAGGVHAHNEPSSMYYWEEPLTSAEIFDPATGLWTGTGSLHSWEHAKNPILLADGRVVFDGKELFDPATGTFSEIPSPYKGFLGFGAGAALLPDGRILMSRVQARSEPLLYDPAKNLCFGIGAPSPLGNGLGGYPFLSLLPDGTALLLGHRVTDGVTIPVADNFDPQAKLGITPAVGFTNVGASLSLSATGPKAPGVMWGSRGGTVTVNGIFSSLTEGLFPVTATAPDGTTATVLIEVLPAIKVVFDSFTYPGQGNILNVGVAVPVHAHVQNTADQRLIWSVSEGPTAGTITPEGLFTGVSPGTCTILATSVADPTKSASFVVQTAPEIALTISPQQVTALPGQELTFTITEPSGQTSISLDAPGLTYPYFTGTITYQAPTAPGAYNLIATSRLDPSKSVVISLTVVPITDFFIAPPNRVMRPGEIGSYRAYARSPLGLQDVTDQVSWGATLGRITPGTAYTKYDATYTAPATPGSDTVQATLSKIQANAQGSVNILPLEAFSTAGLMTEERRDHTMTRLLDGKILVAGGFGKNSAEIYDPSTKAFTSLPTTMLQRRYSHTATLLPDGKVLFVGGNMESAQPITAELFDPVSQTFSPTIGAPSFRRSGHFATRLPNGKVLIASGQDGGSNKSMEVYDPASGTFMSVGSLKHARTTTYSAATLLADGRVLFAGAVPEPTGGGANYSQTSSEVFDFRTETSILTGDLNQVAMCQSMTQAADGRVWALMGGESVAEWFDPADGTFSKSLISVQNPDGAAELVDGSIWVSGGRSGSAKGMRLIPDRGICADSTYFASSRYSRDLKYILLPTGDLLVTGYTGYGSANAAGLLVLDTAPSAVVLPRRIKLLAGQSWPFQASATGLGGADFTWSIEEGASGGSISSQGVYTAPLTPGTFHIVATSVADGSIKASAIVEVENPDGLPPVRISITPLSLQIFTGATALFTPSLDAPTTRVIWSSSFGTINQDGFFTAPTTPGTGTVTVTSVDDPSKFATADVTVVMSTVAITISPKTGTTFVGHSQQFGYTLSAPTNRVVWTCSGGSITQSGSYTAPVSAGIYQVTVYSVDDPSKSDTCTVTVKDITLEFPDPVVNIHTNEAWQFGLTYDIPPGSTLIWSASSGTISQTGYFVPSAGAGTYTVSVACSLFPDSKQTSTVNVTAPTVQIRPDLVAVAPNRKFTFQAITNSGSVTWSVVEPNGGTIDSNGLYTAPTTLGTFTVKATSTTDTTQSATSKVLVSWSGTGGIGSRTVTGLSGISLTLSPTLLNMNAGSVYAFEAVVSGTDNTAVNWQVVNNPSDATIDANGAFTASRHGSYQVMATSVADPSLSIQAGVQVNPSVAAFDLTSSNGPQAGMQGYSLTALADGRVLIAGGREGSQPGAPTDEYGNANVVFSGQAWIYDPLTGEFAGTGTMILPRGFHQAVLMDDGRVLMSGGYAQWANPWAHFPTQTWAQQAPFSEVYNPASGTFQNLGPQEILSPIRENGVPVFPNNPTLSGAGMMLSTHPNGEAIKLSNGKVLAIGGDGEGFWGSLVSLAAWGKKGFEGADLFDPVTGTFDLQRGAVWRSGFGFSTTSNGSLGFGQAPRAENLSDGRVLITSGAGNDMSWGFWYGAIDNPAVVSSVGIVADPITWATMPTERTYLPRFAHSLTRLPNGKILAAGGKDWRQAQEIPGFLGTAFRWATTASAELYDPATNTWTPTGNLNVDRAYHAAILLPTGKVLIVGGYKCDLEGNTLYPNTTEVYDPDSGTFSVMDHMDYGLSEPKMVLLPDGNVFLAGQIQAPMEPPPSQSKLNGMRMMAANTLTTGDSLLGIVTTPELIHLGILRSDGSELSVSQKLSEGEMVQVNVKGYNRPAPGEDDLLRLKIHRLESTGAANLSFKLHFASSKIAVWKDASKNQAVQSDTTTFPIDADTLVYVEGLQSSTDMSGEIVELQLVAGTEVIGKDLVKIIVSQMVFAIIGDGGAAGQFALANYLDGLVNNLPSQWHAIQLANPVGWDDGTSDNPAFSLYNVRTDKACFSVWTGNTQKFATTALGANGGYVVYDGHSNYGIGFAFSKNLTSVQNFMNLGEELVFIDWLDLRNNQGHPTLIVRDTEEYGDDITTTDELYDPVHAAKYLYGQHEDSANRQRYSLFLSDPGGNVGFPNLHLVRSSSGSTPWNDYHAFPEQSGRRNIVVKGGSADIPSKNWKKLFINACNSGIYYIRTMNHGTLFYTTQLCSKSDTTMAYVKAIVDGNDDEGIYTAIKIAEPLAKHDYRLF